VTLTYLDASVLILASRAHAQESLSSRALVFSGPELGSRFEQGRADRVKVMHSSTPSSYSPRSDP